MSQSANDDFVQRFLFDDLDIRGALVRLGPAWRSMLAGRAYAPAVQRLLGETTAVAALVGANLKQTGRLTLQVRGHGPVRLMVVDCTSRLGIRGMALANDSAREAPLSELLGDGQLVLTLDTEIARQPYQSVVPLQGDTVAAVFEHYLAQSEQQPTSLWLAASADYSVGLFLQQLPGAAQKDADGWDRVQHLAATVTPAELAGLAPEELLTRLFPDETLRLFSPTPVTHDCPEDWGKAENLLRSLGREEVESILREHGEVVLKDDICNRSYRFDADAIARLFDTPPTLH